MLNKVPQVVLLYCPYAGISSFQFLGLRHCLKDIECINIFV